MLRLIQYEVRKLMSWKNWIIALSAIVLLPLLIVYNSIPDPIDQAYHQSYRGIVNETWFANVEKTYEQLQKEYEGFSTEEWEEHMMDPHDPYGLHQSVYTYGKNMVEKPWTDKTSWFYENTNHSDAYKTFVKTTMEEHEPYVYGDDLGGREVIWTLTYVGILVGGFVAFIMSRIFNMDQDSNYDLLKSTKEGRRKVGFAKAAVVLGLPLLLSGFVCLMYLGITSILFHPDYEVSTMAGFSISPYTYGDVAMYGCVFMILGTCALSIVSATFSSIIKSRFTSLVMTFLFFVGPIFTQNLLWDGFAIARLIFPSNFMFLQHTLLDQPMVEFLGNSMMMPTLVIMVWFSVLVILSIFITIKFQRTART